MPRRKKQDEAAENLQSPAVEEKEQEEVKPVEKAVLGRPVLEKGSFKLFEDGDGYLIMDKMGRVISRGSSMEQGSKLLHGLAR